MKLIIVLLLSLLSSAISQNKANFIIIFTDDQGYADLSCFGSKTIQTPNIDKLAASGIKFTDFYSASSVCTPSRAALLTGRMPKRSGMTNVLFPWSQNGLPQSEITIAEMLKSEGYTTALIGKWHLGHKPEFLPTKQGFDYYYGIPYSNDMSIAPELKVAADVKLNDGFTMETVNEHKKIFRKQYRKIRNTMPMMRGEEIVEYPVDQRLITRKYTNEAVAFIKKSQDKPFFLYLAHTMPHKPLFIADDFKGKSKGGIFGDIIEEIDWSVGEIRKTLEELKLSKNTFILYTSDNGPAKGAGGSAGPLRGVKFNTWEGGQRIPAIISYPAKINAGQSSNEIASTVDIFQTIAAIAGTKVPRDRTYDGYDLTPLLFGETKKSPRNEFFFYSANSSKLDGIRLGQWKYLIKGGHRNGAQEKAALYKLDEDISEENDLSSKFPEKVEELKKAMKAFDETVKNK